uniref:MICOS complex subunit MIC60 n=1 Tax=Ascaris lumbricoides TaxID=6252 RepID=A0A9J2PT15_ASCLU
LLTVAKPFGFVRHCSSNAGKSGSRTKNLFIGTSVVLAGAGGVLAYGCYHPEFRHKTEEKMPWTKWCFEHFEQLLRKPKSKLMKPTSIAPMKRDDFDPNFIATKNKELEAALVAAIEIVEKKVRIAKESKLKTIAATREHAALLKKAVDDAQGGNWSAVSKALENAESFAKGDQKDEYDARNSLDNLEKIVLEGKECPFTSDNKLIVLATETANKLNKQLDELNLLAEAARTRSRIATQYKVLVEESRRQFAEQLKKISPHIDIQEGKMTASEMKAVIDHARAEVDSLHRRLIEEQLDAERKIAKAVEAQRLALSKLAKQELETEQARTRHSETDGNSEIIAARAAWESELKERLARAAAAHEEHMQQVDEAVHTERRRHARQIGRSQSKLEGMEIALASRNAMVDEAVHTERRRHARQIGRSQSKLEGMEIALASRNAMDSLNRRTKHSWLACQNVVNSVINGRSDEEDMQMRRLPLAAQLIVIKEANSDDEFIEALISSLPNESIYEGVYTEADLKERFVKVEKVVRSVAHINEHNAGPFAYGLSYVRSKLRIDPRKKMSSKDRIDPKRMDTNEILDRAKYFLQRNDLTSTVRLMQLLGGEAARVAHDWIKDTRMHLETKMIAEALVAHSTINGIRTTY